MKVGFTYTTEYLDAHLELTMKEYEDLKTSLLHANYDPARELLSKLIELEGQKGKIGYKQKINTFERSVDIDEDEEAKYNNKYTYLDRKTE